MCTDIDECSERLDNCHLLTKCINMNVSSAATYLDPCTRTYIGFCLLSQGSFTCGPCPDGYSGDGVSGCTLNIDYCKNGWHNCDRRLAVCAMAGPGIFTCKVLSMFSDLQCRLFHLLFVSV